MLNRWIPWLAGIVSIFHFATGHADVVKRRAILSVIAIGDRCVVAAQDHFMFASPGGFLDDVEGKSPLWLICKNGKPRRLSSDDQGVALARARAIDHSLRTIKYEASQPRRACTRKWCVDLRQEQPHAQARKGVAILPLPPALRAAMVSTVVAVDEMFIAWQELAETDGDTDPHHHVYRWEPSGERLEKFNLKR